MNNEKIEGKDVFEAVKSLIKEKNNILKELDLISKEGVSTLGKYLGYPSCCTDEFVSGSRSHIGGRKLEGTGYIPCKKCNNKTEEELLNTIKENRICPTNFPKMEKDLSFIEKTNLLSPDEKRILIEWETKGLKLIEELREIKEKKGTPEYLNYVKLKSKKDLIIKNNGNKNKIKL